MQRHTRSANIIEPPVGKKAVTKQTQPTVANSGSAVSRGSAYSNLAPSSSITTSVVPPSVRSARIMSLSDFLKTSETRAWNLREPSGVDVKTYKDRFSSFHFSKIENASCDEIMFMMSVETLGPKLAAYLGCKFRWKCRRPRRALRAMMSQGVKTYTTQSAKTRP